MSKLNTFVTVHSADGDSITFGPDDELPAWAEKAISNPNVWDEAPKSKDKSEKSDKKSKEKGAATDSGSPDGSAPAGTGAGDGGDGEPPRAGGGSGLDAWKAFAAAQGIEVPEDAKREDIFALVDAKKEQ